MGAGRIFAIALRFHPIAMTILYSLAIQVGYTVILLFSSSGGGHGNQSAQSFEG